MEKPLHVRVAEAIEARVWTLHEKVRINGRWWDVPTWLPSDYSNDDPPLGTMPGGGPRRYDTDWNAMGPQIERLGIQFHPTPWDSWFAAPRTFRGHDGDVRGEGRTHLLAACALILAMAGMSLSETVSGS